MTTEMLLLGDLVSVVGGGTPDRGEPTYWGSEIPWATVKDLAGPVLGTTQEFITSSGLQHSAANMVPAGSIVLATRMAVGRVAINTVDLAINQDLKALTCDPRIDARFLLHFLTSQATNLARMGQGATVKGITLDQLARLQVPVAPLPEQLRIAAMLDKADAVRRKRWESVRLLDEFVRSVFLEMFGDPVRNEKGWAIAKIGDIASETQYGTSDLANEEGRGRPVLRMNNLTTAGAMDLSKMKWCEIAPGDISKYTVQRGDLLFNRTNSPELVGKTAVWDRDESYAFAGYLVRVRFDLCARVARVRQLISE